MSINKRRDQRKLLQTTVWHGEQDPKFKAELINVSYSGLGLRTRRTFQPGSRQVVKIPWGGKEILVRGQVRWALRPPKWASAMVKGEMGIRIISYDKQFPDFIESTTKTAGAHRGQHRMSGSLEVSFPGTGSSPFKEYTKNISAGGVFIITSRVYSRGDSVTFDLTIPGTEGDLQVEGKVVHVIDREDARAAGVLPGIGVRLHRLPGSANDKFYDFVTGMTSRYVFTLKDSGDSAQDAEESSD